MINCSIFVILPDPYYKSKNIEMVSNRRVTQVVLSSCCVVVLCCEWVIVENRNDCEVWDCRIYCDNSH